MLAQGVLDGLVELDIGRLLDFYVDIDFDRLVGCLDLDPR